MKALLPSLFLVTVLPAFAVKKPAAFQPQAIVSGGEVIPLYPPDSPFLKTNRIGEAEKYNTATNHAKGPITNVLNIHNPSIEVHLASSGPSNTGTAIILAAGGGHENLWVGPEGADYVPYFAKEGISTVILRYRLRVDGYEPTTDAVNDAFQAIRLVRSKAKEWKLDPAKIGIIGFSAGAELSAPAALFFEGFAKKNNSRSDPLAQISARPDFVGIVYPGPTPFTKFPETKIPANVPPAFITCAGAGDQVHALWATDYYVPMLKASVPNVELHMYGRGGHGVQREGKAGIPYGMWMDRYMEWFSDLGFLGRPGVETKAARESADYAKKKR